MDNDPAQKNEQQVKPHEQPLREPFAFMRLGIVQSDDRVVTCEKGEQWKQNG